MICAKQIHLIEEITKWNNLWVDLYYDNHTLVPRVLISLDRIERSLLFLLSNSFRMKEKWNENVF